MRTIEADAGSRAGRLAKARRFAAAAHDLFALAVDVDDVADAFVTLAVHSGIASSDVICAAHLGEYSTGQSHSEAVALLARADRGAAAHLRTLLALKTSAGYSSASVSSTERIRAERAMDALLELAMSV